MYNYHKHIVGPIDSESFTSTKFISQDKIGKKTVKFIRGKLAPALLAMKIPWTT